MYDTYRSVIAGMLRTTALLALAGAASAFAPIMSMDVDRRAVIQTGVAGAVAAVSVRQRMSKLRVGWGPSGPIR